MTPSMRLLLVDGTNVVMRCASVQSNVPPEDVLASAERMLRDAAAATGATHCIVAFDSVRGSFRRETLACYKANRTTDSGPWSEAAREAFEANGLTCMVASGYEADDVIATLARRATRAAAQLGVERITHILSGDSDLLVLASDHVHCWTFGRKGEPRFVERTPAWICERYGIARVDLLTDLKTLAGEPGDNVPGPFGKNCQAKARKLLAQYGSAAAVSDAGVFTAEEHERFVYARMVLRLQDEVGLPPIYPRHCALHVRRGVAA